MKDRDEEAFYYRPRDSLARCGDDRGDRLHRQFRDGALLSHRCRHRQQVAPCPNRGIRLSSPRSDRTVYIETSHFDRDLYLHCLSRDGHPMVLHQEPAQYQR